MAFLLGKACNALLSFSAFVLIVRLLDTTSYAIYISCIAVVELTIALTSVGLDWVAIRYIPEYRLRADQLQFQKFLLRLLGVQALILVTGSVMTLMISKGIAEFLSFGDLRQYLTLYSFYIVAEGLGRIIRDQFLGQLLLQKWAQLALLFRNAALVSGLLVLSNSASPVSVDEIAISEIAAAAIGTFLGAVGLLLALLDKGEGHVAQPYWLPPRLRTLWRFAAANYASFLCSLAYGPQVVIFLLSRFSGAEATAAFGFARNLTEQVKRYLPIELFLGLIRPTLIAQYVSTKDLVALNRNAGAIVLISYVVLSPIIVLTVTSSSVITTALTNKHLTQADIFTVLMVCSLIPFGLRRFVETIANTLGHPAACTWANAAMIVFPFFTWLSLNAGFRPYTAPLLSLVAECIFCFLTFTFLRRSGYLVTFPWRNFFLISCAISAACIPLVLIHLLADYRWATVDGLAILLLAAIACSGISLVLFRPLDRHTLESIKSLVRGRRK